MGEGGREKIERAMGRIPGSVFVMTSKFEDRARGVRVHWVQRASVSPPMIMVALPKGRPIIPLLHDSHAFAVCQVAATDKLTQKKFAHNVDAGDNPFEAIETRRAVTGSPILSRALAYVDCDLVRHIDVDGDHDIYVGLVRDGDLLIDSDDGVIVRFADIGAT